MWHNTAVINMYWGLEQQTIGLYILTGFHYMAVTSCNMLQHMKWVWLYSIAMATHKIYCIYKVWSSMASVLAHTCVNENSTIHTHKHFSPPGQNEERSKQWYTDQYHVGDINSILARAVLTWFIISYTAAVWVDAHMITKTFPYVATVE